MCRSGERPLAPGGLHPLEGLLPAVHHLVRLLEDRPVAGVLDGAEVHHAHGHHHPARPEVLLDLPVEPGGQGGPVLIVLALQQGNELVPPDAEDRAVLEGGADEAAGADDVVVPLLVALGVVDLLEAVEVEDRHGEGRGLPAGDPLVQLGLGLHIGQLALHPGEGVGVGQAAGGAQRLLLGLLPEKGLLQPEAVGLLLVLDDEGVEQAAPQQVAHGVQGEEGVEDLHRHQQGHGQAEDGDGAVVVPGPPPGAPHAVDGVKGGQQEEEDLDDQGGVPDGAGVVGPGLVQAEEDGAEEVHPHGDNLEEEEDVPRPEEPEGKAGGILQIEDHIPGPEEDREGHGEEVDHGVSVEQEGEARAVEQAPEDVGDVVGQDAEEEEPVGVPHRLAPAGAKERVLVDDEQDQGSQQPDGAV